MPPALQTVAEELGYSLPFAGLAATAGSLHVLVVPENGLAECLAVFAPFRRLSAEQLDPIESWRGLRLG